MSTLGEINSDQAIYTQAEVDALTETDLQLASSELPVVTTSLIWSDLPGATVTTINTAGLKYMITASMACSGQNNLVLDFRLVIAGVVVFTSMREFSGNSIGVVGLAWAATINTAKDIKIQWKKTGVGTLSVHNFALAIQGVK